MKIVAFILSFLIFGQSLTVCRPSILSSFKSQESIVCSSDTKGLEANKKSCCTKNKKSSDQQKDKKGCCGDNCQCLTCGKVFLTTFQFTKISFEEKLEISEKVIYPIFFHSFDFHPSIAYPPNV
jgi:hypothetical protein